MHEGIIIKMRERERDKEGEPIIKKLSEQTYI